MTTNKNVIKILHISHERIRMKYESIPQKIVDLDEILSIEGVKEVTYNKLIGSFVINYLPNVIKADEIISIIKEKYPKIKFIKELILNEGFTEEEINAFSRLILDSAHQMNKWVLTGLRGRADLSSLVPLLLFIISMSEFARKPSMPNWFLMLRASGDSFLQWMGNQYNMGKTRKRR